MNWWQYLLLVNIYLVLFYAFYVLLLLKETFFQLNRIYLVTAALLSFFIPMIQADWVQNLFITQQVKYTIYSSQVMIYSFKPIQATHISVGQVLAVLYGAGILVLTIRLIWQLVKLKRVINQPEVTAAYSFFKKVKLNEENADNLIIEAHEQVHAQQWHSADVLLIELIMIINWFNPVVYLYRFAIKHIHEYIADRQAVQAGTNKAEYALLLLSQTFHAPAHQLVNPFFNHSLLKQRIIMLQKNKSQRISLIKYGLSAPLFILMLVLSSATINNSKPITSINKTAHQLFTTPASSAGLNDVFDGDKPSDVKATMPTKETTIIVKPGEKLSDAEADPNQVFTSVELVPEFPGGLDKLGAYLGKTIHYPALARENGTQGRVIITFVVEKDGSLSDVKVTRGIGSGCDEEALRVMKNSPKWKPGIQNGRFVRVQYSIPISFTLDPNSGPADTAKRDGRVFTSVEQVPQFPGGLMAFGRFLSSSIKYPKADFDNGTQGRVIVTFIVEQDGALSNIKITRGISEGLDNESLRVLKNSPKWQPGIQNGKPVRVQYSVPVSFTLNNDKSGKPEGNKIGSANVDKTEAASFVNKLAQNANKTISNPTAIVINKNKLPTDPLYILDGKVITNAEASKVSADDIESLSVIKDKSATAIYGDKGANGVILIVSKNKKNKTAGPKSNN
ncbi:MAG: TonB family protein [Mucilaginibacter sp.]|nr:TonB family protein [Mucilaginibacter sp.]